MRKKLYGMLVATMLLMVVTSSLNLPILGPNVQDFARASSKTTSTNPVSLLAFMWENVSVHEDGTCRLAILMNVSSGPLNDLYRRALGLGSSNLTKEERMSINETIPVHWDINTNATLLPGGYEGVGNTSIANLNFNNTFANHTDTLQGMVDGNLTQDAVDNYKTALQNYLGNATFTNYTKPENTTITVESINISANDTVVNKTITQPVKKQFLEAIIQEQALSLGIHITDIEAEMWGPTGECWVKIDANASLQVVHCGKIAIGPLDLNASLDRAGFILTKIGFIQQMLSNFTTTYNQEYTYNNTWTTNIFLPQNAVLANPNELEPKRWTVDFGNGTCMNASIVPSSQQIVLTEKMGVTNKNITKKEHELLEQGLLCYKVFNIECRACAFSTSTYYESKDATRISDNWSWKWEIRLWEGTFTLEWMISTKGGHVISGTMDVYSRLDLKGYVGWKFKWFKLKWCRAWMELDATLIVNITIPAKYEHSWSQALFWWKAYYSFFVGPIPVVTILEFKPIAALSVGMEYDAKVTFGVNATGKFRAGAGWKRGGGWEIIYDASMEVNLIGPDLTPNATNTFWLWITPSVQFRLSLLFYGLVGPFVEFEPYLKLTACHKCQESEEWFDWTDLGLNVNVGVEFAGVLKKLLRLSDFKWRIWNKVLWSTLKLEEYDMMITSLRAPEKALVGENVSVSLDVLNKGTEEEGVNVTLSYWDDQSQTNCCLQLKRGEWETFNFTLSTDDMSNDTYPITANASIPGRDDATPNDNNRTVEVRLDVQNVTIVGVTTNATFPEPVPVVEGQSVDIDVTVKNTGSANVSALPVSAYYNMNLISDIWCEHTRWVFDLEPGSPRNLPPFTWNTTGVDTGNYTISAYAWPLPYETNETDNTREANKTVTVLSSETRRDIAIKNVTPSRTVFGQGCHIDVAVTVKNEGEVLEPIFYVTVCTNTIIIETKNVTNLDSGNETTIIFTWNTTGVALGNYVISAYAHPVQGETDTEDNTYIDGTVTATLGLTNVTVSHCGTLVNQAYKTWTVDVSVTIHNYGCVPINCTVNAYYYNATFTQQIGVSQNVTNLDPGNTTTLIFSWDFSILPVGVTYTVKANATCTGGGSDEFVGGLMEKIPWGDVNGNGLVGFLDFGDVGKMYLIYSGVITDPPDLVRRGDINGNCLVGFLDFGDVGKMYLIYSGILTEEDC